MIDDPYGLGAAAAAAGSAAGDEGVVAAKVGGVDVYSCCDCCWLTP